MRVTSDIWVHVFVRRETNRSAFATVVKKGAIEAGAIFVVENHLDGSFSLHGPAPQSLIDNEIDDRVFETVRHNVPEDEVKVFLDKQQNFDPDIWIVETECRLSPPSIDFAKKPDPLRF
jgi:hypothetical protein